MYTISAYDVVRVEATSDATHNKLTAIRKARRLAESWKHVEVRHCTDEGVTIVAEWVDGGRVK